MDEVDDEPFYVRAVLEEKQNTVKFTGTEENRRLRSRLSELQAKLDKSDVARDYLSNISCWVHSVHHGAVTVRACGIYYGRTPHRTSHKTRPWLDYKKFG